MNPKFSIIIPVFNVEKYLRECLDSVLNQTYLGGYEVICVNDGSTDSSLSILLEYAEKYSMLNVIDSENGGTASARNIGLRKAKGEYIWFVDSDDWVELNSLQVLSEHLEKSKPDVLCFNGKLHYDEDGTEEQDEGITENQLVGWEYYNKYALVSRKFHFVSIVLRLYRREFLLKNNLYFEKGILHEDNLWVPQMCYYAKTVSSIPASLYVYRIREGSKMRSVSKKKVLDIIRVANKLSDFFIPKKDIDKSVVYRDLSTYYPNVLVIAKNSNINGLVEECYELFDLETYKIISSRSINVVFYFLIKVKSPLIFKYPQISKLLRKLFLI